jgi:hypothetical protein
MLIYWIRAMALGDPPMSSNWHMEFVLAAGLMIVNPGVVLRYQLKNIDVKFHARLAWCL